MRNIKLTLEYDGTHYAGWQIQPNGIETIQGVLARTLSALLNESIRVAGASRTDAGVHATGQVAAFKSATTMPITGMQIALNNLLPPDIVITSIEEVPLDFDPRRHAQSKRYLYRILNRRHPSSLNRFLAWHIHHHLDIERMVVGAKRFIGSMDFTSFMARNSDAKHFVREITSINIRREGDFLEIEVTGTAFLRHMVRIIVGTLVSVGKGNLSPDDIPPIIESRDRRRAAMTAPPHGLYLQEVIY